MTKTILKVMRTGLLGGLVVPFSSMGLTIDTLEELKQLSLTELSNIEVSIASKTPQRLFDTPASVFVITAEDIERSGATRLPDLLRMVPGFNVAHIDNNIWAVSARGFSARFSNKLLVSIDGRTIYNPLFSGVFWEMQDVMPQDIARIEVIRGPGGSVWGANAVNGVVNIITKKAKDNQGGRITGVIGNTERIGSLSYGGKAGESLYYHFSAKMFDRENAVYTDGSDANDAAVGEKVNLRVDWQPSEMNKLSFSTGYFDGHNNRTMTIPNIESFTNIKTPSRTDSASHFLMLKWQHEYIHGGSGDWRLYYDKSNRRDRLEADVTSEIIDIEYQHQTVLFEHHSLSWGLGFRLNNVTGGATSSLISFDIKKNHQHIYSAHIQDTISLNEEQNLFLTLGSKFELNDHSRSDLEVQPTIRLSYNGSDNLWWGAISKAVRTPSFSDHSLRVNVFAIPQGGPNGLPIQGALHGSQDVDSGKLLAYEIGFRSQKLENTLLDFTVFYNEYDNLMNSYPAAFEPVFNDVGVPEYFRLIEHFDSGLSAITQGFEAAIDWQFSSPLRLRFAYSYLNMKISVDPTSSPSGLALSGESPRNQFSVHSFYNLNDAMTIDLSLRYVDKLRTFDVDSYVTADILWGWTINPQLKFSLSGRNLLDKSHAEYGIVRDNSVATNVERSILLSMQWTF